MLVLTHPLLQNFTDTPLQQQEVPHTKKGRPYHNRHPFVAPRGIEPLSKV